MKRLHVNVSVPDLDAAVAFYSALFDAAPVVHKADYAKWLVEDPRVNFAVTTHGAAAGIDHLGIQVETAAELAEVRGRLAAAGAPLLDQDNTTCCYAQSSKHWTLDPQGIAWESFLTHGQSTVYGTDEPRVAAAAPPLATAGVASPAPAAGEAGSCCKPVGQADRQ